MVSEPPPEMILGSTIAAHIGQKAPASPDFAKFVSQASVISKLRVLSKRVPVYFKLDEEMGSAGVVIFKLRLIVDPTLLRNDLGPSLNENARIAIFSVAGAVFLTFLFSTLAFRPLGKIGHMLDLVARGEFEPEVHQPVRAAKDELSVMASKVSLLGQRLRGAQFEVHDLRGNIDRLLEDLEDAVFIFDREMHLVFASGSVERFMARDSG